MGWHCLPSWRQACYCRSCCSLSGLHGGSASALAAKGVLQKQPCLPHPCWVNAVKGILGFLSEVHTRCDLFKMIALAGAHLVGMARHAAANAAQCCAEIATIAQVLC